MKLIKDSLGRHNCGANRTILTVLGSYSGSEKPSVYITNGTPASIEEAINLKLRYLMSEPLHATELINQIGWCTRCVELPKRQCDLSSETRNKMGPQADTE